MRYQLYKCEDCKEKFIADKKKRWTMVGCEKGCSMVDAEESYSRFMGKPKFIKGSDNLKDLEG
jgi:hypothetical protein